MIFFVQEIYLELKGKSAKFSHTEAKQKVSKKSTELSKSPVKTCNFHQVKSKSLWF